MHPVHPTSIAARAAPSESRQLPRIISRARLRDSDADLGRRRRSRSPHWLKARRAVAGRSCALGAVPSPTVVASLWHQLSTCPWFKFNILVES